MDAYYLCLFAGIVITGVAQVLMRVGSKKLVGRTSSRIPGWELFAGYALFFGVTVLNVYAFQAIPLKTMTAWSALTYVWVMFLAWAWLKEPVGLRMVGGCVLIVAGIGVFTWTP